MNNKISKALNCAVTQNKFVNKDTNEYIYASLSKPPIKIINKNNSDDEFDYTVECPNCGRYVNYGTEIFMLNGYLYCSEQCRKKLLEENEYLRSKYE